MLTNAIKAQAMLTDSVIVLFSGKDSIVALDLCNKFFNRVVMLHMYYVKGLSFVEENIKRYENRYGVKCLQYPHPSVSAILRAGLLHDSPDPSVKRIKQRDILARARNDTGIRWVAGGERINDSPQRRAMIKKSGTADAKSGRFYPIAEWTKSDVLAYIGRERLPLPKDYELFGRSFGGICQEHVPTIAKRLPRDMDRIRAAFPKIDIFTVRAEHYGKNQAPGIHD